MSRLQDYLALPDVSGLTEEIYINERLGTFTVKPMTDADWNNYRNRCVRKTKRGGSDFDTGKFNLLVAVGQTISPNFSDAEFLSQAGCATAAEFFTRKFKSGEIADVAKKVVSISGFDDDPDEEIEEAGN